MITAQNKIWQASRDLTNESFGKVLFAMLLILAKEVDDLRSRLPLEEQREETYSVEKAAQDSGKGQDEFSSSGVRERTEGDSQPLRSYDAREFGDVNYPEDGP